MDLYYFWNDAQKLLLEDYFLPSLQKTQKKIHPIGIEFETKSKNSDFGTLEFRNLMLEKTKHLIELTHTKKEAFLVSDIDIQFFDDISPELNEAIDKNVDITFQKELQTTGINTGFMLIQPTERTCNFWLKITTALTVYPKDQFINEQYFANQFIGDITHNTFDKKIWCWSQGGLYWHSPETKNIKLHHANCTKTMQDKIYQLNFVKKLIRSTTASKKIPHYRLRCGKNRPGSTLSGSKPGL